MPDAFALVFGDVLRVVGRFQRAAHHRAFDVGDFALNSLRGRGRQAADLLAFQRPTVEEHQALKRRGDFVFVPAAAQELADVGGGDFFDGCARFLLDVFARHAHGFVDDVAGDAVLFDVLAGHDADHGRVVEIADGQFQFVVAVDHRLFDQFLQGFEAVMAVGDFKVPAVFAREQVVPEARRADAGLERLDFLAVNRVIAPCPCNGLGFNCFSLIFVAID